MRSCMDVAPDALPQILHCLGLAGVKVVGSGASENAVRLVIEGECVPEAEQVTGRVGYRVDEAGAEISITFSPAA